MKVWSVQSDGREHATVPRATVCRTEAGDGSEKKIPGTVSGQQFKAPQERHQHRTIEERDSTLQSKARAVPDKEVARAGLPLPCLWSRWTHSPPHSEMEDNSFIVQSTSTGA